MNIVLFGPPGAGAAQCAERLARRLDCEFATVEAAVEEVEGKPAAAVAVDSGMGRLRALESALALALLEGLASGDGRILALDSLCLGSSPQDPDFEAVRARLRKLRGEGRTATVYLAVDLATLTKRTGIDGPRFSSVASPRKTLLRQMAQRAPLYERHADVIVDVGGRGVEEVVEEIVAKLR